MKRLKIILVFLIFTVGAFAHGTPVDVAEQTIKVGGAKTESLYYGFAKGDVIIFNFSELKNKELKEIEIIELPSNSKFSDFKSKKITDKRIKVNKKAVYQFKFKNSALSARVCKIKIQRIPIDDSLIDFNTDWQWKTLYDTTWINYTLDSLVGYDSTKYYEKVKELKSEVLKDDMIMDKTQRVHSYYNSNHSYTYLKIDLPRNQRSPYQTIETVSWAYWIGVGEEAAIAYKKNVDRVAKLAKSVAKFYGSPLAAFSVGIIANLIVPSLGHDVEYAFMLNTESVSGFLNKGHYSYFDKGKGIAAYSKRDENFQGTFFLGLHNDNKTVGIDVNVKIVVVRKIRTFHDVTYTRIKRTPKYVTLNKKRRKITTTKIRVNAG